MGEIDCIGKRARVGAVRRHGGTAATYRYGSCQTSVNLGNVATIKTVETTIVMGQNSEQRTGYSERWSRGLARKLVRRNDKELIRNVGFNSDLITQQEAAYSKLVPIGGKACFEHVMPAG